MIKFLIDSSINTGKTGDVERSPCPTPMLILEGKTGTSIRSLSSPKWLTFCLGILSESCDIFFDVAGPLLDD